MSLIDLFPTCGKCMCNHQKQTPLFWSSGEGRPLVLPPHLGSLETEHWEKGCVLNWDPMESMTCLVL
jgi:hypothetical protein